MSNLEHKELFDSIKDDVLEHHGIIGMKWGIRRYQNKDGSLTPRGQKRYNKEMEKLKNEEKRIKNERKTQKKLDRLEAKRKAVEELKKSKNKTSEETNADDNAETKKTTTKKSRSQMTNEELKAKIERLELEKRVADLEKQLNPPPPQEKKGNLFMDKIAPKLADGVGDLAKNYLTDKLAEKLGLKKKDPLADLKKEADKADLEKRIAQAEIAKKQAYGDKTKKKTGDDDDGGDSSSKTKSNNDDGGSSSSKSKNRDTDTPGNTYNDGSSAAGVRSNDSTPRTTTGTKKPIPGGNVTPSYDRGMGAGSAHGSGLSKVTNLLSSPTISGLLPSSSSSAATAGKTTIINLLSSPTVAGLLPAPKDD